jgi:hypothetical protein
MSHSTTRPVTINYGRLIIINPYSDPSHDFSTEWVMLQLLEESGGLGSIFYHQTIDFSGAKHFDEENDPPGPLRWLESAYIPGIFSI